MADLAQYRTWLTEAEGARHQFAMGETVIEWMRDGRRMTFAKSDQGKLDDYILFLQNEIAKLEDAANGTTRNRRRSISVMFGG